MEGVVRIRTVFAAAAVLCASALVARAGVISAGPPPPPSHAESLTQIMVDLAPQSAQDAATIREQYAAFVSPLVLSSYGQIEEALATGGLVPLRYPYAFNIAPRLDGENPIAEKDLANQTAYISARPAALGCLLDIGSRVRSGFLEVTSLVRHTEYQETLLKTNGNAFATVPTHTMGLAFDIGLVHTPLKTVAEIRDVLQQMRDAGDILFIAERHQLTFHVVPRPSRLGYFSEVYRRALAEGPLFQMPIERQRELRPSVVAETVAVRPTPDYAVEWWAADNVPVDVAIRVAPDAALTDTPRGIFDVLASFVLSIRTYLLA